MPLCSVFALKITANDPDFNVRFDALPACSWLKSSMCKSLTFRLSLNTCSMRVIRFITPSLFSLYMRMFEFIIKYTRAWSCLLLCCSIGCSSNGDTVTKQQNAIIPTTKSIGLSKSQPLKLASSPALMINNELHALLSSSSVAQNNSEKSFQLTGALAAARPLFASADLSVVTLFNQLLTAV